MKVVRQCLRCKKLSAEYKHNNVRNLVFNKCVCCGYSAKDYIRDLKGTQ
jgi:hypothetical protein